MSTHATPQANDAFRHKLSSILFLILALNAAFLLYLLTDSNRVFVSISSAKLSAMLDHVQTAVNSPSASSPSPVQTASEAAAARPASTADQPSLRRPNAAPPSAATPIAEAASQALTMLPAPSLASTGTCYALENFKSDIQSQSAKALLASGPLRGKSWAVSTPYSAQYVAGVDAANADDARRIAKELASRGIEPLSMTAKFVALATSDNEASAQELAASSLAGIDGMKTSSRMVQPAGERHSIVLLAQTRLDIQAANALTARLPGLTLTGVPCPQAAAPLLARR